MVDYVAGPAEGRVVGTALLHDLDGIANWSQGIAQLVSQHRQKLVLAGVGLGQLGGVSAQLVFQAFPLREVKAERHNWCAGLGGSTLVEQSDPEQHGKTLAIRSPTFQLERGATSPALQLGAAALQELDGARRDERIPGKSAGVHLLAGIADHLQKRVVGVGDVAFDVSEDDTQDVGFDQAAESGLARTKVSNPSIVVPNSADNRAACALTSWASWISKGVVTPTISSAEYPSMRSAPGLKTVISPSASVAMIETWVEASSRALSRALTCISSAWVRRRSANMPICCPSVVMACKSGSSRSSGSRDRNVITPRIGPASLAMIGKLNALRRPVRTASSLRTNRPPGSCVKSAIQAEQPVDQTRPVIPTPGGNSRFSAVMTHAGPTRCEVHGCAAARNTPAWRSTIQHSATSKSSKRPMV